MKILFLLLLPTLINGLPYYYNKRNNYDGKSNKKISPVFGPLNPPVEEGRMFGLDTGNDAADFEAGVWLMALVGTLAAAVPVAFLNPSLGFKKRSLNDDQTLLSKLSHSVYEALYKSNYQQNQQDL